MIGEKHPEWQRLADALGALAREVGASNGFVLDSVANLWCSAKLYEGPDGDEVMDVAYDALTAMPIPLKRGGRIDRVAGQTYLRSFAGIYVLALRFTAAFDLARVRASAEQALPRIEALTLQLPPPDGPGSGGSEGFGVA